MLCACTTHADCKLLDYELFTDQAISLKPNIDINKVMQLDACDGPNGPNEVAMGRGRIFCYHYYNCILIDPMPRSIHQLAIPHHP